jgi:hypothetical protein
MIIKQLSVFLEDKVGRLAEMTKILADNNINLIAFSVADAADYGIARFIVDKTEKALKALKENLFAVSITDVVGVVVPNQPGGLNKVLQILSDKCITVDYMYAFDHNNTASAIIRSSSNDKVIDALQENQMTLLSVSDLYKI